MQKIKKFIRGNYKLVSVALVASLTGGLIGTVLVTQAAIPASDGTIHGCRNSTTTMLRVIDNSTSTCDSSETALNWDQKGVKAYAHVVYSSGVNSLDTNRSYNFTNLQYSDPPFSYRQVCLTVTGTPNNISAISESNQNGGLIAGVGIKDGSGWTSTNTCDTQSPGSNVFVKVNSGTSFFVTVY